MRTYLRIINPIVAALVLVLCVYASIVEGGKYTPDAMFKGSISTYFLAKGLFCSSALFILGRILLVLIAKSDDRQHETTKNE
ncbi:MAG: hypothetical protein U1E05_24775 [Patescibacteria group bacterium]|nr:hypothetical protein [Patescibacteria group bacterium]